jgi:hypothetical protein
MQVLDDAVEYELLDANAARGKRRRMKVARSRRSFLEPDMEDDLLREAGDWEAGLPDLELTAFLLDELRPHLAAITAELRDRHRPGLPIFPSRTGGTLNASNVRNRLLKQTVKRVNERREKDGRMLLPASSKENPRRSGAFV